MRRVLTTRNVYSVGVMTCLLAASALAETAPALPILFHEAEKTAPRLIEAGANVQAAQGHAQQAAAWPNPVLGVEVENFAGGGAYRGTNQAQTTFSISEPLELGGQRGARAAAGRATATAAQMRQVEQRVAFGYDLAMAYAEAEAAQARGDLLTEDLNRAQEDLRTARALVDAGREGELRAVQAEAAAAASQAELVSAKAELIAALAKLSSLTGAAQPYSGVAISLLNANTSAEQAATSTANSPMVATAQAERDSYERRLTMERKQAIPSPSLSVGIRNIGVDNVHAWVGGISIPLPVFNRNKGEIAAARADLTAADARLTAARLETEANWRVATAQSQAAVSQLQASDQSEAAAREAYRLARIGYDAGRTPLYELLSTRRALTEAQSRSLTARVARVRAEASLARLAGRIPFVE